MSKKRRPTSELNHENWDKDDDPDSDEEVRGGFTPATPEELQNRVIRVAKRRSVNPAGSSPANSPFSTFKGFQTPTKPADSPNIKPSFDFITNAAQPTTPKPNFDFVLGSGGLKNGHVKVDEQEEKKDSKPPVNFKSTSKAEDSKKMKVETSRSDSPKPGTSKTSDAPVLSTDYFSNLKSLNTSVATWINQHVNENPYCILTPVFKDYEKHLTNIEHTKPPQTSEDEGLSEPSSKAEEHKTVKTLPSREMEVPLPASKSSSKLFSSLAKNESDDESSDSEKDSPTVKESEPLFPKLTDTASSPSVNPFKIPASSDSPAVFSLGGSSSAGSAKFSTDTPGSDSATSETSDSKPQESTTFTAPSSTSFFQAPMSTTPSIFGSSNLFGGASTASTQKSGFNPSNMTFTFGNTATSSAPTSTPAAFQFGSGSAGSGGFSFSGLAAKAAAERSEQAEEEPEEPPKVEFNPISEEGSKYETKCKVYVKKEGEYKDRGVGMLYIKQVGESKSQLLVRAATTTGQILLNVLLSASLPTPSRQGAKDLLLMCLPTPADTAPAAVLLRVKSGEVADELLAKIEEHKK